jgi:hypothetical protein
MFQAVTLILSSGKAPSGPKSAGRILQAPHTRILGQRRYSQETQDQQQQESYMYFFYQMTCLL